MKKVATLSLAILAITFAFAQNSKEEARRVILGQPKNTPPPTRPQDSRDVVLGPAKSYPRYPNSYPNRRYSHDSRAAQIDQVNRKYNYKIASIRNNRALTPHEKARIILDLNNQRNAHIRQINHPYSRYDRRYDDDYKERKYNKHNTGKHLGWQKGKGNPHRRWND